MKITQNQLRQIIRESLHNNIPSTTHSSKILEENIFKGVASWVKSKGASGREKLRYFMSSLKQEMTETREGAQILVRMIKGQKLDSAETAFLKEQAKDIVSGTFLLGLFALPGGAIATTALVRVAEKLGINLMPSSFQEKP